MPKQFNAPVLLVPWYDDTKWPLEPVASFLKNQRFIRHRPRWCGADDYGVFSRRALFAYELGATATIRIRCRASDRLWPHARRLDEAAAVRY